MVQEIGEDKSATLPDEHSVMNSEIAGQAGLGVVAAGAGNPQAGL